MKKNITINLCGRLFQIDEDACDMLQHYVDSLRSSFGKQEGGDEIVDDIEARIAELFDELRQQGAEAINISHVKDVITRIGRPEQLAGDETENGSHKEDDRFDSARSAAQDIFNNVRERTAGKKLFRNPKDKMLAGVLSGFAAYTNTDPVIWRLLTVLLFCFYGVGLLAYIVLAIVLPEAKTPEQLLMMEGKQVTPQNLADVVLDKNAEPTERPSLLRSLFSLMLKVLFGFFVGVAVIVGIMLCIAFLFALVVLVCVVVFPITSNMPFSLSEMGLDELYQTNPATLILFAFSLFMLMLIPIYAIIHMVLTLAGKTQPMGIGQRIVWVVLWIAALCCIVPCSITMANHYNQKQYVEWRQVYSYQGVEMSEEDADFLRQGSWDLVRAIDCDHFTWSGRYPTGDHNRRYLDTYNDNCEALFQAERKQEVMPGVYRLDCLVRAEGPGAYIYAKADDGTHLIEIPPYGDKPAGLYDMLRQALTDSLAKADALSHLNLEIDTADVIAHSEWLDGWSVVTLENITTTDGTIAYGMTSDADKTGHPCRAKWFSATDFTLTRTGDLPKADSKKRK